MVCPDGLGHALEAIPGQAGGEALLDIGHRLGALIRQRRVHLHQAGT